MKLLSILDGPITTMIRNASYKGGAKVSEMKKELCNDERSYSFEEFDDSLRRILKNNNYESSKGFDPDMFTVKLRHYPTMTPQPIDMEHIPTLLIPEKRPDNESKANLFMQRIKGLIGNENPEYNIYDDLEEDFYNIVGRSDKENYINKNTLAYRLESMLIRSGSMEPIICSFDKKLMTTNISELSTQEKVNFTAYNSNLFFYFNAQERLTYVVYGTLIDNQYFREAKTYQ